MLSVIGGVFGALPAYVVVYALDSMETLRRIEEAEEAKRAGVTARSNEAAAARVEGETEAVEAEAKKAAEKNCDAGPAKGSGKKKKKKKRKKDKGSKSSHDSEQDSNADADGELEEAVAESNTEPKPDIEAGESAGETAERSEAPRAASSAPGDVVGTPLAAAEMKTVSLCPSCQSPGRERDELFLCSNPSCNNEFFEFEAHNTL
jgi:hypothetical protein